MTWEHKIVRIDGAVDEEGLAGQTATLDTYGRAGWELVQIIETLGPGESARVRTAIFKRAIPDDV